MLIVGKRKNAAKIRVVRQKKLGVAEYVAIYGQCRNQRNRKTAKYDEHREKATYLCNVERNKIFQTDKNENDNKQQK